MTRDQHAEALAEELADELRSVIRSLHDEELGADQLEAALEHARALHRGLGGPRRMRWFEERPSDARDEAGGRDAFLLHSLFRGVRNPLAPPLVLRTTTDHEGRRVMEGRVTCSGVYEGPPHGVHGGYVAGLFDDVLGAAQVLADGPTGVTGTLSVRYRRITPLERELRFTAWIDRTVGRRIHAKATCHAGDVLTAEAEALFIRVDMDEIATRPRH
jgi:acyl-coenzyme A thioesterase PaaI-like protein